MRVISGCVKLTHPFRCLAARFRYDGSSGDFNVDGPTDLNSRARNNHGSWMVYEATTAIFLLVSLLFVGDPWYLYLTSHSCERIHFVCGSLFASFKNFRDARQDKTRVRQM